MDGIKQADLAVYTGSRRDSGKRVILIDIEGGEITIELELESARTLRDGITAAIDILAAEIAQ